MVVIFAEIASPLLSSEFIWIEYGIFPMALDKAPCKSARSMSAPITVVPERCISTVDPFSTMIFGVVYA